MSVHSFGDNLPLNYKAKITSLWLRCSPINVTEKPFSAVRLPTVPLTLVGGILASGGSEEEPSL